MLFTEHVTEKAFAESHVEWEMDPGEAGGRLGSKNDENALCASVEFSRN